MHDIVASGPRFSDRLHDKPPTNQVVADRAISIGVADVTQNPVFHFPKRRPYVRRLSC